MSHLNPNHNITESHQTTPPNFFKQDLIPTPCTTDKDEEHEEIKDSDKKEKDGGKETLDTTGKGTLHNSTRDLMWS